MQSFQPIEFYIVVSISYSFVHYPQQLWPALYFFGENSLTVWIIEIPFTKSTPTPSNAIVTLLKCASSCHEIQSVNISSKSLSRLDKHLAIALLSALYVCEDEIIVKSLYYLQVSK